MSIRGKLTLVTLSAFIAIYAVAGGLLSNPNNPLVRAIADPGPYPQLRIFEEVVRRIVNDYVEKPDLEKVRIGALRGLTDVLDPYSAYLLPPQVKEYEQHRGNGDAAGMILGQYQGFAYVIAVVPASPADKAGIRAGDVIEYIDGHATRDLDLYDMRSLLLGAPGTTVELSVFRNNNSEKIKVTRGQVLIPRPEIRLLEQQIGYLRPQVLKEGQAAAVQAAVGEAIKRGAQRIILDLRGSAGGELKEGVAVANLFLKSGTIVQVLGRKDKVIATYEAKPENAVTELPVAVIVDRTTAGAAEIVAAAILENKRGEVIGERTFGVGSEQELFLLGDGSALLLTTARYASPQGRIFMLEGVVPSIEVKRTDLAEVVPPEENEPEARPATPRPGAVPSAAPKPADDLLLKRAIEVLTSETKLKRRAA